MGQRRGFGLSDEVIGAPGLVDSIRKYEQVRPAEGHIMRWHIDQANEVFDRLDLNDAVTSVLHGDFTPWNLLYEGESLTGILDFEATHLNYRVADFANSWRGYQDEVIDGYEEVLALSDLDWQLLVPAYWAWMFIGVKQAIETTLAGKIAPPDFEWQIRHLLRREGLTGRLAGSLPQIAKNGQANCSELGLHADQTFKDRSCFGNFVGVQWTLTHHRSSDNHTVTFAFGQRIEPRPRRVLQP